MKPSDMVDMRYWFPKLQTISGVRVPKTIMLSAPTNLISIMDGKTPEGFDDFIAQLQSAMGEVGLPAFLRTGHGSGKHYWKDTCYVTSIESVAQHIYELVEWSLCVDLFGLPIDTWAVREFLPCDSPFTAFLGQMPITKECRVFISGGHIVCHHPYWPEEAIEMGEPTDAAWKDKLAIINTISDGDLAEIIRLAELVAMAFPECWSVDLLHTQRGWFVIDMAPGEVSFHWPGCPQVKAMAF